MARMKFKKWRKKRFYFSMDWVRNLHNNKELIQRGKQALSRFLRASVKRLPVFYFLKY